ncbi:MAG: endonuclease MutS2 [Lachnospiraceae bacterium]|nr:endonuclease MutS2 [Lachnospiraceae bacterium]
MNEKVLRILEFDKITEALSEHAGSEPGKKICLNLRPSSDKEWTEKALAETDAAFGRFVKDERISFGANKDVRGILKAAGIGRRLEASDLLTIARILELSEEVAAYGKKEEDAPKDVLDEYFERIDPLGFLSKEIKKCILSEEEIADDASPSLKDIRRGKKIADDRIHRSLTEMVNGAYRTYLQDPVITTRDGRYCIPVKAEHKSQVPGILHDRSATGSTLFIEPSVVVNLSNELRELEEKEKEEIEKILKNLSAKVATYKEEIGENQKTITMLDYIFAKAKYAAKLHAGKPEFSEDRVIKLVGARHPLLPEDKAVPIDVRLGEEFGLLIITGPNTGGKTVSLKTVGLLTLMGMAGLYVPARSGSTLGFFKEIYADIGDEQSIEQSLSTFSAHMTSIVQILKKATPADLCLFDELGAGTDPTEGAALAMAILDHLHEKDIRSMATTHYSELKVYALQKEGVSNACCEFDVETLRPTYKLLIGIPGKSNAFAISSKLGLSDEIIEKAKENITSEEESFETVIADLNRRQKEMMEEQEQIRKDREELETLRAKIKEKEDKLEARKEKVLLDAKEEARELLKEAKEVADETIRAFHKQGDQMNIKTMERKRSNVREKLKEQESALQKKAEDKPKVPTLTEKEAVPGTSVKIISMGMEGTITKGPGKDGKVSVQCGIITSKVALSDLTYVKKEEPKNVKKGSGFTPGKQGKVNISKASNVSAEINVLGLTVDEAVIRVDKFLDDAYLCHLNPVRVVHGKGTGALRSGIHAFLNRCPYVAEYHLAAPGEGDAGVTIVELA